MRPPEVLLPRKLELESWISSAAFDAPKTTTRRESCSQLPTPSHTSRSHNTLDHGESAGLRGADVPLLIIINAPRPRLAQDDFFNPPAESDPAADFLAREKALLGDEFSSGGDATSFDKDFEQSASAFPDLDGDDGLQGFVSPAPAAPAVASIAKGPYEGGMGSQVSVTGTNEFAAFESEYPEVEVTPAPQVSFEGFPSRSIGCLRLRGVVWVSIGCYSRGRRAERELTVLVVSACLSPSAAQRFRHFCTRLQSAVQHVCRHSSAQGGGVRVHQVRRTIHSATYWPALAAVVVRFVFSSVLTLLCSH